MKRIAARARATDGTRRMSVVAGCAATGLAVTGLAGVGLAGTGSPAPAVMAGVRSARSLALPDGWPAAKVERMRAADQLRRAAVGRPLLPPPALPAGAPSAQGPGQVDRQSARLPDSPAESSGGQETWASAGQAALTQGIVPLANGGPFPSSRFLGTNLWNGRAGSRWEVIQAGGVPADPALGAASPAAAAGVFVYTRSPDPASSSAPRVVGVRVPVPAPRGTFTARRISGDVLTLSLSGSRKLYHFNAVTLRFTP